MLNNRFKVIALDLDGTVSQHKSKLNADNKRFLYQLMEEYQVVFVGAGTCKRIYKQLEGIPVDIIGNYGMQFSKIMNNEFTLLTDYRRKTDREKIMSNVKTLRKEFMLEEVTGELVEFHDSGVITIPLLGTEAKLADKLKYDPQRLKRRRMLSAVRKLFPDYTVFIGGSSSFDAAPRPYTKLYGINEYLKRQGMCHDDVVYIGDDYGRGGNDEDIYHSDIKFLCIDDYRNFPEVVKEFLL